MDLDIRPRAKRTDQVDQFAHGGFSSIPCVDDGHPSQVQSCEGPTASIGGSSAFYLILLRFNNRPKL